MLFIDDISFIPASSARLEINGYNIWKDGILTASVSDGTHSYLDTEATTSSAPEYRISTVYAQGESRLSDIAELTIAGLATPDYQASVKISSNPGVILVSGAGGMQVDIIATDGRKVASIRNASAHETIHVSQGIYIVTAGSFTAKIVVD